MAKSNLNTFRELCAVPHLHGKWVIIAQGATYFFDTEDEATRAFSARDNDEEEETPVLDQIRPQPSLSPPASMSPARQAQALACLDTLRYMATGSGILTPDRSDLDADRFGSFVNTTRFLYAQLTEEELTWAVAHAASQFTPMECLQLQGLGAEVQQYLALAPV